MTTDEKIETIYQIVTGQGKFRSNSGDYFLIREGTSNIKFHHSPTGQSFRVGTVLRNPAGWYMILDESGDWSSTREIPQ